MFSHILQLFLISSLLHTEGAVINEVYMGNGIEWVEIYNNSSTPIDLSRWRIANSTAEDTLEGIVEPFSFFIISSTRIFPVDKSYTLPDSTIGGGLKKEADTIILFDDEGNIVDFVVWGTPSKSWKYYLPEFWNTLPGGYSDYARIPNGQDTDTPGDWTFGEISTPLRRNEITTGLTPYAWDKIKELFSEKQNQRK